MIATTVASINAPTLFGGDKKEGGIQGTLWVYMGEKDSSLRIAVEELARRAGSRFSRCSDAIFRRSSDIIESLSQSLEGEGFAG